MFFFLNIDLGKTFWENDLFFQIFFKKVMWQYLS